MNNTTHKVDLQNCTRNGSFCFSNFNGKEKDWESGFHYYGARYYWSEVLTGWLSVDPMIDKYPSISPYAYCAWNPVVNIDPDGRRKWPILKEYNGANRIIVSGMYRNSTGKLHGGVDIAHRPVSGPPNLEGGTIYATHDGIVEYPAEASLQVTGLWYEMEISEQNICICKMSHNIKKEIMF